MNQQTELHPAATPCSQEAGTGPAAAQAITVQGVDPAQHPGSITIHEASIDMGQIREIRIPARNSLDPIIVFVQDPVPGQGRIVVICDGNAWHGHWESMGARKVVEFVAGCAPEDLSAHMIAGNESRATRAGRDYVRRVAREVISAFWALAGKCGAAASMESGDGPTLSDDRRPHESPRRDDQDKHDRGVA